MAKAKTVPGENADDEEDERDTAQQIFRRGGERLSKKKKKNPQNSWEIMILSESKTNTTVCIHFKCSFSTHRMNGMSFRNY